jgi:hypothetical protein
VSWSLEDHGIKLLTKKTQYPDVNRRVSGQPAQSAYEYAVKEVTNLCEERVKEHFPNKCILVFVNNIG